MTDNITVRRAEIERIRTSLAQLIGLMDPEVFYLDDDIEALAALDAALAEPDAKREPVAYLYHDAQTAQDAHPLMHSTMLVLATDRRPEYRNETPLYAAPPEPDARREPATNKEIDAEWLKIKPVFYPMDNLSDFRDGFRAAEQFHSITKEDKT